MSRWETSREGLIGLTTLTTALTTMVNSRALNILCVDWWLWWLILQYREEECVDESPWRAHGS